MSLSRIAGYGVGVLAVLVAKAVVHGMAAGAQAPDSPYVQAMMVEMDRQGITDLMMSRVRATDTDEEARQLGMRLSKRGLARLEAPDLALRMQVLLALAEKAGDPLCAALFMGKPDPDEFLASISRLDSSDFATWVRISVSAAKAELTATAPEPPASESELDSALMSIMAAGDSTQRARKLPPAGYSVS